MKFLVESSSSLGSQAKCLLISTAYPFFPLSRVGLEC